MTYAKRPGGPQWSKVVEVSGASRLCSTGTRDPLTADAIEAWHREIRRRGDPQGILRAIVDGAITLAEAYSLDVAGAAARLAAAQVVVAPDLRAHLDGYVQALRKKRRAVKTVAQVRQQLDRLYPDVMTAAMLTPVAVRLRLEALDLTAPTQNRYRAALSGFCRYLVQRAHLVYNPVRDVDAMPERARTLWHTKAQLATALTHCDPETAFAVALAAGGGFEWCAIARVTPERVDLQALVAHAEGGKRPWRNRHVRLYAWTRAYLQPVLEATPAGQRVVATGPKCLRERWAAACVAAEVPVLRLHDCRHTHAVHLLQDGESYKVAAHQLGHRTEGLIISTYGVHAVTQQSYKVLGHERPARRRPPATTQPPRQDGATAESPVSSPAASEATGPSTHSTKANRHAT